MDRSLKSIASEPTQRPTATKYDIRQEGRDSLQVTFNSPEMALYWQLSDMSKAVSGVFKGVRAVLGKSRALIENISDTRSVMDYLQSELMSINWFTLRTLRLYESDIYNFFRKSKLVENILRPQFFFRWRVMESKSQGLQKGDLVLFYKTITSNLAQEKCYELQGLNKLQVMLDVNDIANFESMRNQERNVLLKVLSYKCSELIHGKLKQQTPEVEVLRIIPIGNGLVLELICFRKHLPNMYEGLVGWLEQLKYMILPFNKQKYPERQAKFRELLENLGGDHPANASFVAGQYHIQDDFLVALDISSMDEGIKYLLESQPRVVPIGKNELKFIRDNCQDFIKNLKRGIQFIDYELVEDGFQIVSDQRSYMAASEFTKAYLFQKMKVDSTFYFRNELFRDIFDQFFKQAMVEQRKEMKDCIKLDEKDRQKISYSCCQDSKLAVEERFRDIEKEIRMKYIRTFVPVSFASAIKSKCAYLNPTKVEVHNPLKERGYSFMNGSRDPVNQAMIRVIHCGQLEILRLQTLICQYDRQRLFMSGLSEVVLSKYGYFNAFKNVSQKDHRKSRSFSYMNDLSSNLLEIMCCYMDWSGDALRDNLNNCIYNSLEKDGIGLIVPEGDEQAERTIQIFVQAIEQFSRDEKTSSQKPQMKNFYLVCESENHLVSTHKKLKERVKRLESLPLNLSVSDVFAISVASFFELRVEESEYMFPPLVAFVAGSYLSYKPSDDEGVIINVPLADGQLYDQFFIDFDSMHIYDITHGTREPLKERARTMSSLSSKYIRSLCKLAQSKHPPRLAVIYLSEKQVISNFFRVKKDKLVKVTFDGSNFQDEPDSTLSFQFVRHAKLDCNVLQGYCQEVLSLITHLQ